MARPFPSIRKPSAGWTGAVNYTLEDHIASPYPHPIYPRKDGVLPNDSITKHMSDAGAHRKYFLSTAELIFTKAEYEASKTRDGATITDPTTRESNLYQYLITAPALAAILADYSASGGFSYENLVKEITGSVGSHEYTMCTEGDTPYYAPSIGLFVDLFDKFNAVVGILPSQSKPTVATPTALTSVFALKNHTHAAYESHGASHNEIWAAINAGGGGGSGGMGGVIDGTLCTDSATGEPCVTEIDLHDGANTNNQTSYTYIVQHNCLLFIQLKNAIIADNKSSSVPRDCILVKAGDQVIGTLTDNMQDLWNELDNDGLRIPVRVGTTITLVGDGTTLIFDETSLTTDSKIVFSEFELTPLSTQVGFPDYDNGEDITKEVVRTQLDTPNGYRAKSDGFVRFQSIPTVYLKGGAYNSYTSRGYINDVLVHYAYADSPKTPNVVCASASCNMIPVRKGDLIDWKLAAGESSEAVISAEMVSNPLMRCDFYPLHGVGSEGDGPIEYPVLECAFTNTANNPFIGTSIPSSEDLTITSAEIERMCGRSNIDLNTCNISLKIDVFTPKKNGATVVADGNGFAEIDKTHPVYRNEAIVYCDADNSPAGYYNDYSRHLDVSVVNGTAKIAWSSAFAQDPASSNVRAAFVLPALSTLAEGGSIANRAEWNDFNNSYGKFIKAANELGLNDCYIRLTAVIDPCTKIINQTVSKAGVFIDGDICRDENGNYAIVTLGKTELTGLKSYSYTVKNDCWLVIDVSGVELERDTTAGAEDCLDVKINNNVVGVLVDNFQATSNRDRAYCSMPVRAGTTVTIEGDNVHNMFNDIHADGYLQFTEFKMSTELTPAKFPSLAIRVCDVDCHDESTNASVLPAGSTCEYFTWTESQMRQVFGSAFDFDHARFDVSAVFYVGNSASDYDTAANKLQDDGILISPTSQGQQVRPSVTIDTVNGERVAKLALPGIDYFCSTVKSDTTDGFKLVTRTDGAHLGIGSSGNNLVSDFNTTYGKKVRMRLLLHVSDRRSEASHVYASAPDWSADAIEIKAGYTHTNYTYTAKKDGYVLVGMAGGPSGKSVAAVVEVNGNRTGSLSLNSGHESDCQEILTPVSSGDIVTLKAGAVDGRYYAYMRFIPAKHTQLEVPDFNIPGSAGVIDGSIWKDSNGNEIIDTQNVSAATKEVVYNVKNDCYLYITTHTHDVGTTQAFDYAVVTVNGVEVGRLLDVHQTNGFYDNPFLGINVGRGSVVRVTDYDKAGTLFNGGTGTITFTEFKLRATNVVAAMPDWDKSKAVKLGNGSVIEADGWIAIEFDEAGLNDYKSTVKINGIGVYVGCGGGAAGQPTYATTTIPVSRGDIVTFAGTDTSNLTVTFYPVKMNTANGSGTNSQDYYFHNVASGDTLRNRVINVLNMSGNTTLNLPASGAVARDFMLTVEVTVAGTLTFYNNDGSTAFTNYRYDARRGADPMTETLEVGKTYQFYFTEIMQTGIFRVDLSEMVAPSAT